MSRSSTYNSRTADKFVIRLPDGMRQKIQEEAGKKHVSMNSLIVQRIEAAGDNVILQEGMACHWKRVDNPDDTFAAGVVRKIDVTDEGGFEIVISVPSRGPVRFSIEEVCIIPFRV